MPARRARRPLRTVGIVGASGAVLLGAGWVGTGAVADRVVPRAEAAAAPAPVAPVLSARRIPSVLSVSERVGRLRGGIANVESDIPESACLVVKWLGRTASSLRPNSARTPASITKIITGAVALEILGADHVFSTSVRGALDASTVVGDLYLVGGGDPLLVRRNYPATEQYPTLSPTYLEDLADAVVAAGVRSVQGSVVGDGSRWDAERYPPTWPAEFHKTEAGPIGPLMVNDGLVIGETAKGDDPAVAAAREFAGLLRARGVTVAGAALAGQAPPELAEIAAVRSVPLPAVVAEMLTNSDDNTAEMLLKEIGVKASATGTWAAGLAAVGAQLASWGLPLEGYVQVDGSGLSSDNKISCAAVVGLLERFEEQMVPAMAVAGVSGTLADDFVGQAVAGRLAAKTGTLSGVKGLAGYLPVEGDRPVVFSLLMTGGGIEAPNRFVPIWNALARAMNRAGSAPSPAELAP